MLQTAIGLELRCGYGEDDLLRSQVVPSLEVGRAFARDWQAVILAKDGFTELAPGA